ARGAGILAVSETRRARVANWSCARLPDGQWQVRSRIPWPLHAHRGDRSPFSEETFWQFRRAVAQAVWHAGLRLARRQLERLQTDLQPADPGAPGAMPEDHRIRGHD